MRKSAVHSFICLHGPTKNVQNEATILTARRKYFQPGKGCIFSLHRCTGPSSLLVAPCYMELLVGVGKVSKVLRYVSAGPIFSLWNDSLGLAYLTSNEVSAKPNYFLASPSLRKNRLKKDG